MPKTHRGSEIGDNFYRGQNVGDDPSRFSPVLMKRVGASTIEIYFLSSLTSIPLIFYRCRRGIGYRRYSYARLDANKKFLLPMPMEIDARQLRFSEWFFSFFEFLPTPILIMFGEVFGC
jgi:hypothetical protein